MKDGLSAHEIIGTENSSRTVLVNIEESGVGVKSAEGSYKSELLSFTGLSFNIYQCVHFCESEPSKMYEFCCCVATNTWSGIKRCFESLKKDKGKV